MEPNKRGLLQLTNEVPLVRLHNQVSPRHQLGDTQKDKAERKPGFPFPHLTSGETEARTCARVIQDVQVGTSSSQNWQVNTKKTKTKLMSSANSKCQGDNMEVEKSFFSCFFNNKDGWFQSISIIPASSDSTHGQFKTTANPNAISICSERHHTIQSKDVGGRRIFSFLLI